MVQSVLALDVEFAGGRERIRESRLRELRCDWGRGGLLTSRGQQFFEGIQQLRAEPVHIRYGLAVRGDPHEDTVSVIAACAGDVYGLQLGMNVAFHKMSFPSKRRAELSWIVPDMQGKMRDYRNLGALGFAFIECSKNLAGICRAFDIVLNDLIKVGNTHGIGDGLGRSWGTAIMNTLHADMSIG